MIDMDEDALAASVLLVGHTGAKDLEGGDRVVTDQAKPSPAERQLSHWLARAERVTDGDPRLLGEDDRGDLYVLTRHGPDDEPWWGKRFNPWNPLHWRFWLRSRLTLRIAFLERW